MTFKPGNIKGSCIACDNPFTETHHIFMGVSRRQKSDAYGLTVQLCRKCHKELHMHPNDGMDLMLKTEAQKYFEKHYGSREKFIHEFGKSWL